MDIQKKFITLEVHIATEILELFCIWSIEYSHFEEIPRHFQEKV
jgi:hypothetical protein